MQEQILRRIAEMEQQTSFVTHAQLAEIFKMVSSEVEGAEDSADENQETDGQ